MARSSRPSTTHDGRIDHTGGRGDVTDDHDIVHMEERSVQDRGGNGSNLVTNLTDFAAKYHDLDASKDVVVATTERGILILPLDEPEGSA